MTEQETRKIEQDNWKLKNVLRDLFSALETAIIIVRMIVYIGSVALAWLYLNDKVLAVAIAISLTIAHLLMSFAEYVQEKKAEITK